MCWRNLCVDCEISIFRKKLTKYLQLHNGFYLFRGLQPLNAVFPSIWGTKVKIWTKSENLKIQDGCRLWPHLFDYYCHGNKLNTTWFRLIENTNETCYMLQVNRMNCVESRRGVRLTPSRLRVTIFSSRRLGLTWHFVLQMFTGNTDMHHIIHNQIMKPFTATDVRIHPYTWYSWPSMRAELYGCQGKIYIRAMLGGGDGNGTLL